MEIFQTVKAFFQLKTLIAIIWRKCLKRFRFNRIHYINLDCFYTLGRLRDSLLRDCFFFSFLWTLLVRVVMTSLSVLQNNYVSIFFTYAFYALFRYMGRLVTNQQEFHFPCLLFIWNFSCAVENPEISRFLCIRNQSFCVQTINKWRKPKRQNDKLSTRNKKSNEV